MPFPSNSDFANRILDLTFKKSKSSGNPMLVLECEVVSPEEVDVAGQMVNIAGVKTINYYSTQVTNDDGSVDDEGTKAAFERVFVSQDPTQPSLYDLLGLDGKTENPENPTQITSVKGKVILTQMSAEKQEQRATPTSKEIEEAKAKGARAEGKVQVHPVTGKPLVSYRPQIRQIFGLAPEGVANKSVANKPY